MKRILEHRLHRVILAAIWSVGVLFLIVAADPPEPQIGNVTGLPKSQPIVGAWLRTGSRAVMRQLVIIVATRLKSYNEISAFSYTIERDGSLTANDPVSDGVLVDLARANGIKVVPTVSSTWDSRNITAVLMNPQSRAFHIEQIMKVARSPLIDGIDIDYENLPPETRQAFTTFITSLAFQLHNEGKTLSVTVMPRVRSDDGCQLCIFTDYQAIGQVADQVRVMAYEYHGKSGGPGPNAPVWWLRQVMSYTVSQVPREKVVLGIHLYGYDWGGKETPALWWEDVQALKEKYSGTETYLESDARGVVGETMLTYSIPLQPCPFYDLACNPLREDHTVWFVDSRYVAHAWEIVKDMQLAGMVMWRPGGEDPAMWDAINPPKTQAGR
jgi:spore germination protein